MEISDLKKKIIFRINSSDENTLLAVDQVLDNLEQSQEDFPKTPSPEIHELLLKSLKQIENGKAIPHEQVIKETREKYGLSEVDSANPPQEIKDLLQIAIKQGENGQKKSNEVVKKMINNKYGFHL